MADTDLYTYNHDIFGIVRRIDRFRIELSHAVSAGVHHFRDADLERYKKYSEALTTYLNWVQAQPQLDLPESHPMPIQVEPAPPEPDPENESVQDLMYMLWLMRYELSRSQSSRLPQGLISFDEDRIRAIIEKYDRFLTDYVEVVLPLDMPESSPKDPMPPQGSVGT